MSPEPGDLFATVPGVASSKGVALNPPPAAILGQVSQMVADAMKSVPERSRGALVSIATADGNGTVNVNMALATRVGEHVKVVSWVGKSWNEPVHGGAAVQIVF